MRTQKGFTFIEFLIVVAILGIIAAIAAPSLLDTRRQEDRKTLFGEEFANLPDQLSPEHMRVLRPRVEERVGKICGLTKKRPAPTEAPPAKAQPATDSAAIQQELNRLAGLPGNPPSESCKAILTAAEREGFLLFASINP